MTCFVLQQSLVPGFLIEVKRFGQFWEHSKMCGNCVQFLLCIFLRYIYFVLLLCVRSSNVVCFLGQYHLAITCLEYIRFFDGIVSLELFHQDFNFTLGFRFNFTISDKGLNLKSVPPSPPSFFSSSAYKITLLTFKYLISTSIFFPH